jgi:hypothetical protein
MRGSAPVAQCLTQWGTPEATDAPAKTTAAPAGTEAVEKVAKPAVELSFATSMALAALALYA